MERKPDFFNAERNSVGFKEYDELTTPFTWTCNYCFYPRRISEMMVYDTSEPCIFCQEKLLRDKGVSSILFEKYIVTEDRLDVVKVPDRKIGINSQKTPLGIGGDDSEVILGENDTINEAAWKRYEKKIPNLRIIQKHINSMSAEDFDETELEEIDEEIS